MTIFVIILVGVLVVYYLKRPKRETSEMVGKIPEYLGRFGRLMARAYQLDDCQIIPRWNTFGNKDGFPTIIADDGGHLTVTCTTDKASFQLIELIEPEYVKPFHKSVCQQVSELKRKYGKGIYSCFKQVCNNNEPVFGLSYYKYLINIDFQSLTDEDILHILRMQRQVTQQHTFPSAVREMTIRYHQKTYEARYESATARELFEVAVNGERKPLPINAETDQMLLFLDELDASEEVEIVTAGKIADLAKGNGKDDVKGGVQSETKKSALQKLKHIMAARDKYISEKDEFESFAQDISPIYKKKSGRKRVLKVLATLSLVFGYLIIQLDKSWTGFWLMVLAVVLGIANVFCRPTQDEIRSMTIGYLKHKNYPKEDEEVAFRAFTGTKTYSDLPQIKHLMAMGLISKIDFEDFDIDIDVDSDFDFDD